MSNKEQSNHHEYPKLRFVDKLLYWGKVGGVGAVTAGILYHIATLTSVGLAAGVGSVVLEGTVFKRKPPQKNET